MAPTLKVTDESCGGGSYTPLVKATFLVAEAVAQRALYALSVIVVQCASEKERAAVRKAARAASIPVMEVTQ